ncbi:regulator of microtubule dynamics protein 2-like [Panonychus citri]|uniref:regulator of microtubule dynamics protein 2-like n=1 Tax=Panonychus citri TaxID=50023 RepID=UPI002307092D|nr:regulator of microtubule dynamics protein 2-like [Panonychus citri]
MSEATLAIEASTPTPISAPTQTSTSPESGNDTKVSTEVPMAKTYEQWIEEIDMESENADCDKDALLVKTKEFSKLFNGDSNGEITWRLARNAYKAAAVAEALGDKDKQKSLLLEAEVYIKKALELDASKPDYHAWAAFIAGKLSDFAGRKERIQRGHEIQHHLDEAIKLKTTDAGVYYTYGRWCMEVAKLSWVERNLAAALFSKPPEASYQDAVNKFVEADKMRPDWRANYFWMAKCYINMKNNKKAIECLDIGVKCTPKDEEDSTVEGELTTLQKKYASYR